MAGIIRAVFGHDDEYEDVFTLDDDPKTTEQMRKKRRELRKESLRIYEENTKLVMFIDNCDKIRPRTRFGIPRKNDDKSIRTPFQVRGKILDKCDDLKFIATFGLEGKTIHDLRKQVNKIYCIPRTESVSCKPTEGYYYVGYIKDLDMYARISLISTKCDVYEVYAIDYGKVFEIPHDRIYKMFTLLAKDEFAYHLVTECCLPQWPIENHLPTLSDVEVGDDVNLYILSDYEPCLTVFVPVNKKALLLFDEVLYTGMDDIAEVSMKDVIDGTAFCAPYDRDYLIPSTLPCDGWILGVPVHYESLEEVYFRDIYMSLRLAHMQQYLNKCMADEESQSVLLLSKSSCAINRLVVAYDQETKNYYRGRIVHYNSTGGWSVECLDYPGKVITMSSSLDESDMLHDEESVNGLYLMPDILGNIPIQVYQIPVYLLDENEEKYRNGIELLCSSMVNCGEVVRVKMDSATEEIIVERKGRLDFKYVIDEYLNSIEDDCGLSSDYQSCFSLTEEVMY